MSQVAASTEHDNVRVDMTKVGKSIRRMHDRVCAQRGRVEITRAGCDDICVMISKAELQSLERALQIFADSASFAEMADDLKRVLALAHEVYGPPAMAE
jgi:hypothetical protein